MISDSGAELLLTAIYRQAREDLEEAFARVMLFRKACEKGRLDQFVKTAGLPLVRDDEQSALWWYSDRGWLPEDLAGMVAELDRYRRHCCECGRREGGGVAGGKVVRGREA
jgi:hypothetical protein